MSAEAECIEIRVMVSVMRKGKGEWASLGLSKTYGLILFSDHHGEIRGWVLA